MSHRSRFLGFIFVVCFMARYCYILVSIITVTNCKRLRRKLSWSTRDANPAFPWIQKKNAEPQSEWMESRRRFAPRNSRIHVYSASLLDSRLPSCLTIPQTPRQVHTSFCSAYPDPNFPSANLQHLPNLFSLRNMHG